VDVSLKLEWIVSVAKGRGRERPDISIGIEKERVGIGFSSYHGSCHVVVWIRKEHEKVEGVILQVEIQDESLRIMGDSLRSVDKGSLSRAL
jgi:hypothetical protein